MFHGLAVVGFLSVRVRNVRLNLLVLGTHRVCFRPALMRCPLKAQAHEKSKNLELAVCEQKQQSDASGY